MLDSPFGIQRSEIENLVLLIYVPHIPQFFISELKKEKKYVNMCKNKKYCKCYSLWFFSKKHEKCT